MEGNISYSFANWQDGIEIEIQEGSAQYGPYFKDSKVFGIHFQNPVDIEITNTKNDNLLFIIGCYSGPDKYNEGDNSSDYYQYYLHPFGFSPIGNKLNKNSSYPIIFSDYNFSSFSLFSLGIILLGVLCVIVGGILAFIVTC